MHTSVRVRERILDLKLVTELCILSTTSNSQKLLSSINLNYECTSCTIIFNTEWDSDKTSCMKKLCNFSARPEISPIKAYASTTCSNCNNQSFESTNFSHKTPSSYTDSLSAICQGNILSLLMFIIDK